MKKSSIGGQAVMEGVMMKAPECVAVAVRKPDGEIVTKCERYVPPAKRNSLFGWPVVRGVVNFVDMMKIGMSTMTYSAEVAGEIEEEPSRFEKWLSEKLGKKVDQVVMGVAVVLGVAFAVGLFIVLPQLLASLLSRGVQSPLVKNLIEGGARLLIFVAYILLISLLKDIRRVFMYHGAEHKVVSCYEAEKELTIENARGMTRLHPRCGTNYMFLVMMVSILFFTLMGWSGAWYVRMALRLLFLPLVAGLSYEVLKLAAASDSLLARIVRAPGLLVQRITTAEPTDDMIEVALTAFKLAAEEPGAPECARSGGHADEGPEERPEQEGEPAGGK